MNTVSAIVAFLFLLALGSILLKEGLHVATPKEKMLEVNPQPFVRKYPKGFAVILGAACIIADLYIAYRFFL